MNTKQIRTTENTNTTRKKTQDLKKTTRPKTQLIKNTTNKIFKQEKQNKYAYGL
jgi:hypothetical protein